MSLGNGGEAVFLFNLTTAERGGDWWTSTKPNRMRLDTFLSCRLLYDDCQIGDLAKDFTGVTWKAEWHRTISTPESDFLFTLHSPREV
ncbi:hypothetical protein CEXT_766081 [Caerostris extrusa]|uniref:Uncharacterized protein n=1 Tax=Caerostris extrusa TaxID=172846 RepID=A0AAV4NI04_CAEEX|nr:hypothetical protein CEXT_766081 [Caerostris extrusa]